MSPILAKLEAPDAAIQRLADEIRRLVWGDLWEEQKAQLIYEQHCHITAEDYLCVWETLDSRTRSAWKAYINQGKQCRQ